MGHPGGGGRPGLIWRLFLAGPPGRPTSVITCAVHPGEGRVRYIGAQSDPGTRSFTVELEVPNPAGRFAAGVSAELRIPFERALAQRVPASLPALNDAGVLGIKAVDEDDKVVFYPADVVRAAAAAVWLAGLPEHVRVITVGQGFVRAGDRVRAVPEAEAVPAGPLVASRNALNGPSPTATSDLRPNVVGQLSRYPHEGR